MGGVAAVTRRAAGRGEPTHVLGGQTKLRPWASRGGASLALRSSTCRAGGPGPAPWSPAPAPDNPARSRGPAVSIRSGLTLPRPPLCLRTNPSNGATPPTRSICTARFRLQGPTRSICIARFRLHGTWLHPSPSHRDSASGPSGSESVSRSTKPRPLPNISSSTFGSSRLGRRHSLTPASGSALGRHQLPSSRNLRPRPLLLQALPSWGVLAPRPNPIGEGPAPSTRRPFSALAGSPHSSALGRPPRLPSECRTVL